MAQPAPSTAAVDAVIDEWAGDLDPAERDAMADEVAYQYYSNVRDQLGDTLDPSTSAQINALARIPQEEKDAVYQRSNRVMRRIARPLGYKLLQLQGLDPATASPDAARAALEAPLTPEQKQEVSKQLEELYDAVFVPEVKTAIDELGLDAKHPDEAWQQFAQEVQQQQRPKKQQQHGTAAVAVPSAVAGAVVALLVSRLFGWIKRRRQQSRQQSEEEEEGDAYASDSLEDDASAYAD